MNDNHVDDLFSSALDGELGQRESREFAAHLAGCERCADAYAGLQRSVSALRRAAVPPLMASEVAATVAAAFPEVSVAVPSGDSPAPIPFTRGRTPWPLLLSHAAAVLLGCTLMFGGRAAFLRSGPQPSNPERVEVPVEVIREVEVEVPFEVIVEVQKEVIREVRVEVPVEVAVETIVEKIVERRVAHPLQMRLDAGYGVASNLTELAVLGARGLGGALELAAMRDSRMAENISLANTGSGVAPRRATAETEVGRRAPGRGARAGSASNGATSALVIQRDGNRLSLRTRGPREIVVPALIDALEGTDRALADAALGQLMSIRGRMVDSGLDSGAFPGVDVHASASMDQPIDRAGGLRGLLRQSRSERATSLDSPRRPASADAWRKWWRETSSDH